MRRPQLLAPTLVLALAACAAQGPRAELDDRLYGREDPSRYGAKVMAIDGDSMLIYPLQLEPGQRRLTVVSLGSARGGVQGSKTLLLDAKACVRYYIAAQHDCISCEDWKPVLYREEPIDACDPAAPVE